MPSATALLGRGGRTLEELRADLGDVLAFHSDAFHSDRPGPFVVVEHVERHYEVAGGELVTRIALDDHRADRQEVHTRIIAAVTVPEQARSLVEQPTNRVAEVTGTTPIVQPMRSERSLTA